MLFSRPKESQCARILKLLQKNAYVTNTDLNNVAYRYGSRLHDLRREGHNIQHEYVKPGVFRYWLVREEENA